MKDASDYLAYIKALIDSNPQVLRWSVMKESQKNNAREVPYGDIR